MAGVNYKTTEEIKTSPKLIEQVIGQESAVEIITKAAQQRRHVLLIGEPGTGKSMLGLGLAELLPKEKLVDILSFPNPNDENMPLIRAVPANKGREVVAKSKIDSATMFKNQNGIMFILAIFAMLSPWWAFNHYSTAYNPTIAAIMFVAFFLGGMLFIAAFAIFLNLGKKMGGKVLAPKLIVDNFKKKQAQFMDATGAHAGALLGDVLHDPFQSGGLGTPAHERVVAGMIHKANMGVLFIDEIATLQPHTQQELLTAIQEGKYSITGQTERSAGAMVRTEPVPCNFVMVAAGNLETVKHMHPALRSRIRGYGYEVYMNNNMKDTKENCFKIVQFIAQEVKKDGKIPHFKKDAVELIIHEARRMANQKGRLTLRFRELGGLIRAAGDIALEQKQKVVVAEHVKMAKLVARTLEKQITDKVIEHKKEYEVIISSGSRVGRINGMAVMGDGSNMSGIVMVIESELTPNPKDLRIIPTGKLGDIAKESIFAVNTNISKVYNQKGDIKKNVYVQFLQSYEGVEGDSATIAMIVCCISALSGIPIRQDTAITGSSSIRGEVLPIGGVTYKIEAAIEAGLKQVIIPKANLDDVVLDNGLKQKIKIIPVEKLSDVLGVIFDSTGKKAELNRILKLIDTN